SARIQSCRADIPVCRFSGLSCALNLRATALGCKSLDSGTALPACSTNDSDTFWWGEAPDEPARGDARPTEISKRATTLPTVYLNSEFQRNRRDALFHYGPSSARIQSCRADIPVCRFSGLSCALNLRATALGCKSLDSG